MEMALDSNIPLIHATEPPPTPKVAESMATIADKFTGLRGVFQQWASSGVIGALTLLLGYKIMISDPSEQERVRAEMRTERQASRDDSARGREHGDRVAADLSTAMGKNTDAIHAQTKELSAQIRAVGIGPPRP